MIAIRSLAVLMTVAALVACREDPDGARVRETTQATYDPETGKLTRVTADLSKNGVIDAWTYMDGARVVRTELDEDGDGTVDRWELADEDGTITRIAWSRRKVGEPDAWAEVDAAGRPIRAWMSAAGDESRPDRWEHYEAGRLVRSEDDTTGDGRPNRWDTYEEGVLRTTAFDEDGNGRPDRRLTYGLDGELLSLETEPDGTGRYRRSVEVGSP